MCRRSTVSSSEPNWPEESSRPHAPDDQGWYTLGGDGWSTSGDQGWYTSGDHARYTSGDCAWSSLGRSMTPESALPELPSAEPAAHLPAQGTLFIACLVVSGSIGTNTAPPLANTRPKGAGV